MAEATEIEKKSLEAHVELCAERYTALDAKLQTINDTICAIHIKVSKMAEKRNDQLINWGIGIITFLVGTIGWLVSHYVIK